jgi:Carboxypeptidase regulatory-like domain
MVQRMRRLLSSLLLVSVVLALLLAIAHCRLASEDQPIAARPRVEPQKAPAYGVRGRVTSAEGAPVIGRMVQAESLDKPKRAIPELAVMTGEDGSYWWPLKPGHYRLSIAAEGYQAAFQEVIVRPDQIAQLDFSLKKAPP